MFFIFITAYNAVIYKSGKWSKWAYNAILNEKMYCKQNDGPSLSLRDICVYIFIRIIILYK